MVKYELAHKKAKKAEISDVQFAEKIQTKSRERARVPQPSFTSGFYQTHGIEPRAFYKIREQIIEALRKELGLKV